ncbi:hypothetical protein DY000_02053201 [Brassica cretica]|uniref:Uncharacterized protein n=1 Tax=Brassica cretica TaxID=69181 RepID=A0ABQ7A869_BRACR|nr:hypothetical protein DY000_02053201 [Brassica cretica]
MLGRQRRSMPLSDGAIVSKIVWLGVKDVFTQIAKDVVGQGLDHGTLTFKGQRALVEIDRPSLQELSVLRWLIVIEDDSMFRKMYPKRFNTELVRSQLRDDCLLGCDRGERNAEASFTRNVSAVISILGESCLELLKVHLANDREERVPFNVLDATFILEFSSSQMFSMLFRDSLGSTETERNALMLEDFS